MAPEILRNEQCDEKSDVFRYAHSFTLRLADACSSCHPDMHACPPFRCHSPITYPMTHPSAACRSPCLPLPQLRRDLVRADCRRGAVGTSQQPDAGMLGGFGHTGLAVPQQHDAGCQCHIGFRVYSFQIIPANPIPRPKTMYRLSEPSASTSSVWSCPPTCSPKLRS